MAVVPWCLVLAFPWTGLTKMAVARSNIPASLVSLRIINYMTVNSTCSTK